MLVIRWPGRAKAGSVRAGLLHGFDDEETVHSHRFLLPSPYATSCSSTKIHLSSINLTCSSSYASRLT